MSPDSIITTRELLSTKKYSVILDTENQTLFSNSNTETAPLTNMIHIPVLLKRHAIALAAVLTLSASWPVPVLPSTGRIVIGRVERVSIPGFNLSMEARIDTGARNCSLHSFNEKEFTVGGERYVEFSTLDSKKNVVRLKSKVEKIKTIRSASGEPRRRLVIKEQVRLGKTVKNVFITLSDRSVMEYRFLVGRNFLRGEFIVDVSKSHTLAD